MSVDSERGAVPPRPPLIEWLQYWAPVAGWMVCIWLLSGDPFSAANTHRYIDPILTFLFPNLSARGFVLAHSVVRKLAHFTEFFVLGSLLYWALRRGRRPAWRSVWALQALAIASAFSLTDEIHQAFVPSRTPSLFDSAVDSSGALTAQLSRWLWLRWRNAFVRSP